MQDSDKHNSSEDAKKINPNHPEKVLTNNLISLF